MEVWFCSFARHRPKPVAAASNYELFFALSVPVIGSHAGVEVESGKKGLHLI